MPWPAVGGPRSTFSCAPNLARAKRAGQAGNLSKVVSALAMIGNVETFDLGLFR
jgi:hypothetical protein